MFQHKHVAVASRGALKVSQQKKHLENAELPVFSVRVYPEGFLAESKSGDLGLDKLKSVCL